MLRYGENLFAISSWINNIKVEKLELLKYKSLLGSSVENMVT